MTISTAPSTFSELARKRNLKAEVPPQQVKIKGRQEQKTKQPSLGMKQKLSTARILDNKRQGFFWMNRLTVWIESGRAHENEIKTRCALLSRYG